MVLAEGFLSFMSSIIRRRSGVMMCAPVEVERESLHHGDGSVEVGGLGIRHQVAVPSVDPNKNDPLRRLSGSENGDVQWLVCDQDRAYRRRPTRRTSPASSAASHLSNWAHRIGTATCPSGPSHARSVSDRWPEWGGTSRPRLGARSRLGSRSSCRIETANDLTKRRSAGRIYRAAV